MKKTTLTLFGLLVMFFSVQKAQAQGCSDAGVCTAPGLHGGETNSDYKSFIRLIPSFGAGDEGTFVFNTTLDVNWAITGKTQFQARLPFQTVSGDLGSNTGLGDVTLSLSQQLAKGDDYLIQGTLGVKIHTNDADKEEGGRPLPMVYQTSLGTTDLLVGASLNYKKWLVAFGYQQPLTGANKNGFLPSRWVGDEKVADAAEYEGSNQLERQGDIVLRIERAFNFEKFNLSAGILPILHLGKDSFVDDLGTRRDIEGSEGLTLNVTATGAMKLSEKLNLGLSVGIPLVVRDHRPAGLTRAFVVSPSLTYNF